MVWVLWGWSISYAGNDVAGIFGDPVTGFLLRDSMTAQDGVFTAVDTSGAYPGSIDVAFQAAFAMITVALISGALAERIKYGTWMIFVALWITLCYLPAGPHGVERRPAVPGWRDLPGDRRLRPRFAGGTVVHINAAAAALIVVLIIGRRKGFGTQPMRRTTCRWSCWARSCCGLAGSVSMRARRSRPTAPPDTPG